MRMKPARSFDDPKPSQLLEGDFSEKVLPELLSAASLQKRVD
jgi:hypothetical protein